MSAQLHREIHVQTTASKQAGAPVRRYLPKVFDLKGFGKLSRASIDAHLDLYQGYVVQTNAVLDSIAALEKVGGELVEDPARPAESLAHRLSFELNGIVLHELFFEQYLHGSAGASGSFERAACFNFGSFEQWQASVRAVARTRGTGWVLTVYDEQRSFLHNVWVGSHDLHVPAAHRVVFVLDLWEHAYLNDYGVSGREEYVDAALGEICRECMDARIDRATVT